MGNAGGCCNSRDQGSDLGRSSCCTVIREPEATTTIDSPDPGAHAEDHQTSAIVAAPSRLMFCASFGKLTYAELAQVFTTS